MSEKALAIGAYCVASGAYVIFGGASPVSGMPDRINDSDLVLQVHQRGLGETATAASWSSSPTRRDDHAERWPTSTRSGPRLACLL